MKERAEHCLQCIQQFFISYVCLSAKPIDNMIRYVNGDKQYQFHDLTVDVEPGHVYSKTGQLRFRTWTNKGKIIRLHSFIPTTEITMRERYRLLLRCSVIQGTLNNAMYYDKIHLNTMLYHSRQCNRVFSLTWPASMQIYWNKRKRLHKKRVQLPEDWYGIPTWPPFHWNTKMAAVTSCENTLYNRHLHDGVILILRPESFSFFLSYLNFVLCEV